MGRRGGNEDHLRARAAGSVDLGARQAEARSEHPRRIEVLFPIADPALRRRLLDEILGAALRDNVKARRLQVDGQDAPSEAAATANRSQEILLEAARLAHAPLKIEPVLRQLPNR